MGYLMYYRAFILWFDHFLDSVAEICQILRWFFVKFTKSKRHSEINWPLGLRNTRYSVHNVTNESKQQCSWDFIFNLESHFRFPYCWIKFDTFYSFQEFSEKTFLKRLFLECCSTAFLEMYVVVYTLCNEWICQQCC